MFIILSAKRKPLRLEEVHTLLPLAQACGCTKVLGVQNMKIVDNFLTSREGDLLKKRKKKTKNKKISLNIFLL